MGMWLRDWLAGGGSVAALLIITGTAAMGLVLGSIRLGRIRLGIAGVLFAGLLLGHLGVRLHAEVLEFARDLGLVLFVYCVGVQVGPGFMASLRSKGLFMNLAAVVVVFAGAGLAVLIGKLGHIPMPVAVGLFSGATTNTPSLGAAQTALGELPNYTDEIGKLPGLGYAVAYPFGVLGVIFTMVIVRRFFGEAPGDTARSEQGAAGEAVSDFDVSQPADEQTTTVQALTLFIGVCLGLVVGNAPVHVTGLPAPLRLGLAAGPMLVAVSLSSFRRIGPLTWRMPQRANLLLREMSIAVFLACVGIRAGDRFVETLVAGDGLYWMGCAALITLTSAAVGAAAAGFVLRLRYFSVCGLMAGSMTDPPALAFASSLTRTREPIVAYATVYPLTQLMRALAAQLMVLLFVR